MRLTQFSERLNRMMHWPTTKCHATHSPSPEKPPLRAELLNVDQLERHARSIASAHGLSTGVVPDKLLTRLAENEIVLENTYDLVTAA
ncbi:MAG: hypothetical protein ACK58T_27740, partial [Phycisphaerae bacterium]